MGSATAFSGEKLNYEILQKNLCRNIPMPFLLDEGDSITLDILENRKTNTKISDFINITAKCAEIRSTLFFRAAKKRKTLR